MIGTLVKYSTEKREIFYPTVPSYEMFDGRYGLVIEHSKAPFTGRESVRVQWVNPLFTSAKKKVVYSDFGIHSFEIINKA